MKNSNIAKENSGISHYQPLFQQPWIEIDQAVTSYSWFEFLLDNSKLVNQLKRLLKDPLATPTGFELITNFLEQAESIAEEGILNARYYALVQLAAQVAITLNICLGKIEEALPLPLQRCLVDGIHIYAVNRTKENNEDNSEKNQTSLPPMKEIYARVLRSRWILRIFVKSQSFNPFMLSNGTEASEIPNALKLAQRNLLPIEQTVKELEDDINALSDEEFNLSSIHALGDIGRYYFRLKEYKKALSYFYRMKNALKNIPEHEKIDDFKALGIQKKLYENMNLSLEDINGYIAACDSMGIFADSNDTNKKQVERNIEKQIDEDLKQEAYEKILSILIKDLVQCFRECDYKSKISLRTRNEFKMKLWDMILQNPSNKRQFFFSRICIYNQLAKIVDISNIVDMEICINTSLHTLGVVPYTERAELIKFTLSTCKELYIDSYSNLNSSQKSKQLCLRQFLKNFLIGCQCSFQSISNYIDIWKESPWYQEIHSICNKSLDKQVEIKIDNSIMDYKCSLDASEDRINKASGVCRDALNIWKESNLTNEEIQKQLNTLVYNLFQTGCWNAIQILSSSEEACIISFRSRLKVFFHIGELIQHCRNTGLLSNEGLFLDETKDDYDGFCVITICQLLMKFISLLKDDFSTGEDDCRFNLFNCLPTYVLEAIVPMTAGLLHRIRLQDLHQYRIHFDLTPYGDLGILMTYAKEREDSTGMENSAYNADCLSISGISTAQQALRNLHLTLLKFILERRPRVPKWHLATADILTNSIDLRKQLATSDHQNAIRHYLIASILLTRFFSDGIKSLSNTLSESVLLSMLSCLNKLGNHIAAAVLCQCFKTKDFRHGLYILQLAPKSHDHEFFQFFWEMPFLEMLVHLHSRESNDEENCKTLSKLTKLIQSRELNLPDASNEKLEMEQRLLRNFFRYLARLYV